MVATMPFVETKLGIQCENAHVGMAKRFRKCRGQGEHVIALSSVHAGISKK